MLLAVSTWPGLHVAVLRVSQLCVEHAAYFDEQTLSGRWYLSIESIRPDCCCWPGPQEVVIWGVTEVLRFQQERGCPAFVLAADNLLRSMLVAG